MGYVSRSMKFVLNALRLKVLIPVSMGAQKDPGFPESNKKKAEAFLYKGGWSRSMYSYFGIHFAHDSCCWFFWICFL